LSRERFSDVRARARWRAAHRTFGSARKHQAQAEFATARFGGKPFDARSEALTHKLEYETIGRRENQRVVGRARLGRERPNPGIELLRGQLLLESTQAGVPEVLHLLVGLKRARILPASRWVIHNAAQRFFRFDNAFARTL